MRPADRDALLSALLLAPRMQNLWDVRDRGMPVFVHQLDVAHLALDRALERGDLDIAAVVIGSLIHDASKMQWDPEERRSHSVLMRSDPEIAANTSMELLADGEGRSGVTVDDALRAHIRHIVLSHHGIYGKVQPRTPEARLVAACDHFSGTNHRLAPLEADEVLRLLSEGYKWGEAAALLGVGREVVKTRLREACRTEGVKQWIHLLPILRQRGHVRSGPPQRERQLARAKLMARLAHQVPHCVIDRLTAPTPAAAALV